MKRLQRTAVIIELIGALKVRGSWCGETHIQKTAYLLQEACNVPLDYDFILYKHGPFSFWFRDELTWMRTVELLTVQAQPYPYGPSILPTHEGDRIKDRFPKTIKKYKKVINLITAELGEEGGADLECLATALYFTKECDEGSLDDRADRIHRLKPHISLLDGRKAATRVNRILKSARVSR